MAHPWVLPSVLEAERRVAAALHAGAVDKEYLPSEGCARFRALTARLVLGEESRALREGRVALTLRLEPRRLELALRPLRRVLLLLQLQLQLRLRFELLFAPQIFLMCNSHVV